MKRLLIATALLLTAACSPSPLAPTAQPEVRYLAYDLAVTDPIVAVSVILAVQQSTHTQGLLGSPDDAARYGAVLVAGTCDPLVSPVSNVSAFYGSKWPNAHLDADVVYAWEGHVRYTPVGSRC